MSVCEIIRISFGTIKHVLLGPVTDWLQNYNVLALTNIEKATNLCKP